MILALPHIGGTPAEHPLDSPDLVPCDLLVFSMLKYQLHGKKFSSDIDIKSMLLLFMFRCAEPCKICMAYDGRYLEEETMPKSLLLLFMFRCAGPCKICMAYDGCYLEEETMPKSRDARDTERCKQSHY